MTQTTPRATAPVVAQAREQKTLYAPAGALYAAIVAGVAAYLAVGFLAILCVGTFITRKGAP